MDSVKSVLKESLYTGFIDKDISSDFAYQPELLVNQKTPPKKILSTILRELSRCNKFYISVAFVTTSGIATIINQLKELEERGIKGQVLVSQYLNFTQPEALKRLMQFNNIELRIMTSGNAHAKGYIFKNNSHYNLIVGSSNLTASALSTNKEWNIKLSALDNSGLIEKVLKEFETDFANATVVTLKFIQDYNTLYQQQFLLSKSIKEKTEETIEVVTPNTMQGEALLNLSLLRLQNQNKALIISATGTGKTYLSAFDAKNFNAKKLLFVVHRSTIARDAMKTFQKVFGNTRLMGLYSGNIRESDCDFMFSTIQTISKLNHLEQFEEEYFDYIIIDETHHSTADSYTRLLDYFKPKFLLGMTATPERTDGNNIFQQFDHNIAYEIRLNRALEEDMLSSFHYYGVTDLIVDDKVLDNKADFNSLVSEERINQIVEQSRFYGSDNGILRGLIFCSRKEEARELSRLLNLKGLKTQALTGDDFEEERAKAIYSIESDNLNEKLDFIITVDIFNEGIDIPKINQIIMLRPTESAIIFIQQLGRGLRKADGKGYLTVIDFIGNYENNYLIPIALYGDTSYNKDTIRKLISEGSRLIPGASTINFDQITKERIFQSIDSANMQLLADLKKDYNLLKFRLGRIPMMMDFVENDGRDPFIFVEYAKSHYNFIKKVDKNSIEDLNKDEIKLLELFAKEINNSKRVEESIILEYLLENNELSINAFKSLIIEKYGYSVSDETIQSCLINLNFAFVRENKDKQLVSVKEIYNLDIVNIADDAFCFSDSFSKLLNDKSFKDFLLDSAKYSISQFDRLFNIRDWNKGFVLYKKYSRKDVFRILNAPGNPVAQNVGGYLVSSDNTNCPIFVNYHKEEHISESTKYEDEFVNRNEFNWMSKSNRKIESRDVQSILGKKGDIFLPLFIKKNNDEGTEFYYMGELRPNLHLVEQALMNNDKGGKVPVVKVQFNVFPSVADFMYDYINDNSSEKKPTVNIKERVKTEKQLTFNLGSETDLTIPLYNFYAAAGSFSDLQSDNDFTLIDAPGSIKETKDYFACKIVGESMNRVIPNGSTCLFKLYSGGSRNGKIVLVENRDSQDEDFNSAFTVKTYLSEKIVTEEGWSHSSIQLLPNSYDESYAPITITEEHAESMKIIGEFISII
jgi:superfamily II DNA or RNA helicase/HKD family nuclease/SOS-response transcriptional repressor LexA